MIWLTLLERQDSFCSQSQWSTPRSNHSDILEHDDDEFCSRVQEWVDDVGDDVDNVDILEVEYVKKNEMTAVDNLVEDDLVY